MSNKTAGVLLFDDVELLDFAGPMEVLSATTYLLKNDGYDVTTIAPTTTIRVNKSNMIINPTRLIDESDGFDLFVIPGGMGTRSIVKDPPLLQKVDKVIQKSKRIASVCTGSLILAQLGYLKDADATSHHLALDLLKKIEPTCNVKNQRYVDNGRFVISAGVSAGIDMAFHIVEQEYGKDTRTKIEEYIEYKS